MLVEQLELTHVPELQFVQGPRGSLRQETLVSLDVLRLLTSPELLHFRMAVQAGMTLQDLAFVPLLDVTVVQVLLIPSDSPVWYVMFSHVTSLQLTPVRSCTEVNFEGNVIGPLFCRANHFLAHDLLNFEHVFLLALHHKGVVNG